MKGSVQARRIVEAFERILIVDYAVEVNLQDLDLFDRIGI